jgi:4-amino-4-deoxy-L-arabinose transferase-like glycosyltransferase
MRKLIDALLTTKGVVGFWLVSAAAYRDNVGCRPWPHPAGRAHCGDPARAPCRRLPAAQPAALRLLCGLQQVVGSGPFSYILLRYALIAAAGILSYFGLMRTVASTRVAAAFSLSLMLFFWFGWEAHHSVSHSLAIIVAMLALWLAALSYVDRPSLAPAFGLGLIVGLDIMAKWSFLLVVISLGMALGLNRSTRRIFADPRSLMILAGALLPVLPFLLWLAALDPDVVTSRVAIVQPGSALEQTLEGAMDFISLLPLVFLPWILVVLGLAYRSRRPPVEEQERARASRLALATAAISAAGMALILMRVTLRGVSPFGITAFAVHYLYPLALFAALGIAGLIAPRVEPGRFAGALGLVSIATALLVFVIKLGSFFVLPANVPATQLLPYARLVEALTARGLGQAQFVTQSPRESGNLLMYLPTARVLSPSARIEPPPPDASSGRPCVLLWGDEASLPPKQPRAATPLQKFFVALGVTPDLSAVENVAVDWDKPLIGEKRRSAWHLLRGGAAEEACRRFAAGSR